VIVDTETGEQVILLNPAADAAGGAGVQAAESVIRHGAEAVISGAFGPNAYDTLAAALVRMFQAESGTVAELVRRYKNNELQPATGATGRTRRFRREFR
jgi:predicted Fe-Mo cluster-binding NifX family protein